MLGPLKLVRLALLLGLPFADFAAPTEAGKPNAPWLLRPGARRVEIRSRIISKTRFPADSWAVLANPTFQQQIGAWILAFVRVPIGMVMLYGQDEQCGYRDGL